MWRKASTSTATDIDSQARKAGESLSTEKKTTTTGILVFVHWTQSTQKSAQNTNTKNSHALKHFNTKDTSRGAPTITKHFSKQTKIENIKHIFA